MFESLNTVLPIFFSLLLTCSLLIIFVTNPIHAVFLLILLFCNAAILLLFFNVEFLALMLIIIYIGAVTILFLFVLMMLDIQISNSQKTDWYHFLLFALFILLAFFIATFINTIQLLNPTMYSDSVLFYIQWVTLIDQITNIETVGHVLYTFYFLFFLLAGLILLIALVGAVLLTYEINESKIIDVSMFKQVSRLKNNAVYNI